MKLVEEILLQPRWDESEFKLVKQQVLSQIQQEKANPNSIARNEFKELIYGENNILAHNNLGTTESVNEINISDLKSYYNNKLSPLKAKFLIVGAIEEQEATNVLKSLSANWKPLDVKIPEYQTPKAPDSSQVYFYDVPGAKQSVIMIGAPAMAATSKEFYPAEVMNYRLGGGGFASQLTQQLREGKGYTYGIRSGFNGSKMVGPFVISSGVRSNITFDALDLIKEILTKYPENFDANDLEVTKSFMIKSNARKFETLNSKLDMLSDISNYDLSPDFISQREKQVEAMSIEEIQEIARKYVNPNKMYYLVVGDAATQIQKLEELGFGKPVLLNEE